MESPGTPRALSIWFVVHFVADVAIAIPLLAVPVRFLTLLGFQSVDPVAARLVAAALFGIGIESLLMRRAPHVHGNPWSIWVFLAIFVAFNVLWAWWFRRVRRMLRG
ncbi:MAG: hypothetical protein ACLFP4_11140 [Spirochaetales bacterium]